MTLQLSKYGFLAAEKCWKIKEKRSVLTERKMIIQTPNGELSISQKGGWLK